MGVLNLLDWLAPYRFSWLAVTVLPLAALGYAIGMRTLKRRGERIGMLRPTCFFVGIALCYIVLHTKFDYFGQFLFFMHRGQHLVLHHLGALLIALGDPLRCWRAGLRAAAPDLSKRPGYRRWRHTRASRWLLQALVAPVRVLQHPITGSFVFVGLIYFWLTPRVHFDAMLSHELYLLMNWSMLVDGVVFWMVIVDPRSPEVSRLPGYATRFLMIVFTTIPQIVLGAYITFSRQNLYDVYAICGRAWPITSQTDQLYGGILTWIPPAMMELVAALVVLSMLLARERRAAASFQRANNT